MSKYIDADLLRKEIERQRQFIEGLFTEGDNSFYNGQDDAYNHILSFLDSLPEQPVEGLEEAARHSEILTYPMPEDGDIEKVMKAQEARIFHEIGFKAGAEWQRKQDQELIELVKDHAMLVGMNKMEQQIVSIIESRIKEIIGDAQPNPVLRIELQGIIDKIK